MVPEAGTLCGAKRLWFRARRQDAAGLWLIFMANQGEFCGLTQSDFREPAPYGVGFNPHTARKGLWRDDGGDRAGARASPKRADNENDGKGDPVTKLTRPGANVRNEARFAPDEGGEDQIGAAEPFSCDKDNVASIRRLKKSPARPDVTDEIGRGLRNIYNDVLAQPVPDRFFDLLKQLERSPQLKKDAS